ncbi:1-deoxy-D-xylulose-5-phosphate synthase [Helicovermis profundi]|uniref:1-deoxy-D-xylulose-5-phosphate synthase n=1 Tax=Helicovermis profundi TaxID=3065157 RepID=A0AAU9EV78_9FIRM|nr:1-deoxy-D-xylulose-5-phosphate synthase [Clostridia bacterium S502]
MYKILDKVNSPIDLKKLNEAEILRLSVEIREFLLDTVSKTGGHLASNLGVVELTIALHLSFDSPSDRLIWDVGHQSYIHKILTGRKSEFCSLRKLNGMSGFLKINDNEHDIFGAGHSSTSISAAYGVACARTIKNEKFNVVAIIGDGALTGGMAFEALNNIGHTNENVIIVLNDNEMSISENIGGVSKYLSKLRTNKKYFIVKNKAHSILDKANGFGTKLTNGIKTIKGSIKYLFVPGIFFEDLGITYIGPIDGHNMKELSDSFARAKNVEGPVLVHVITKKGKGYLPAENSPDLYHGVGTFDRNKGIVKKNSITFSTVLGESLVNCARLNEKVLALTAAMPTGTGLTNFKNTFPKRYIDVGIAEQHAVTASAGLAIEGLIPVFAVYSTFLQRAYDQIVHDVCLQNLKVIFAIDRSGVVGADGETHNGIFDIAYLSHIPNITILVPRDGDNLSLMLDYAVNVHEGPIAIRYPRSTTTFNKNIDSLNLQPRILRQGSDGVIFAIGNMIEVACLASKKLQEENIFIRVVEMPRIKPLDEKLVLEYTSNIDNVFTIEDHVVKSGFGDIILDTLVKNNVKFSNFNKFGYPDKFIEHGSIEEIHKIYGLTEDYVYNYIYKVIRRKDGEN